jgi:signal transduction histidine kinase
VAGVAGGLSERTGLDVSVIRVALVLSALVSGIGVVGYVVAWLLLPIDGQSGTIGARAVTDRRGFVVALALLPALVATLVVASALNAGFLSSAAWAVYLSAAGLILVYRNAGDEERAWLGHAVTLVMELGSGGTRSRRSVVLRVVGGLVLLLSGVALLAFGHSSRTELDPVGGVLLLIASLVVVFGPWWMRLTRELVSERQARIRAEERADMAARVHDSVLQTLALIQRSATEPDRVVQLARAQERELRSWLFEGHPVDSLGADEESTLAAAVERMAHEVEVAHGVAIEAVVVGDCPLDPELAALVAAGREAAVNAAKWSQASVVSVFTEVGTRRVSLFVRDRGSGFDPDAVAADRQGIATSIRGRMERAGGAASIRSSPGQGCEIELTVPRRGGRS